MGKWRAHPTGKMRTRDENEGTWAGAMVSAVGWVSKGGGLLQRDVTMSIRVRLSLPIVPSAPLPPAGCGVQD
eukprot:5208170-Pyramimonas_sp.AAC.1